MVRVRIAPPEAAAGRGRSAVHRRGPRRRTSSRPRSRPTSRRSTRCSPRRTGRARPRRPATPQRAAPAGAAQGPPGRARRGGRRGDDRLVRALGTDPRSRRCRRRPGRHGSAANVALVSVGLFDGYRSSSPRRSRRSRREPAVHRRSVRRRRLRRRAALPVDRRATCCERPPASPGGDPGAIRLRIDDRRGAGRRPGAGGGRGPAGRGRSPSASRTAMPVAFSSARRAPRHCVAWSSLVRAVADRADRTGGARRPATRAGHRGRPRRARPRRSRRPARVAPEPGRVLDRSARGLETLTSAPPRAAAAPRRMGRRQRRSRSRSRRSPGTPSSRVPGSTCRRRRLRRADALVVASGWRCSGRCSGSSARPDGPGPRSAGSAGPSAAAARSLDRRCQGTTPSSSISSEKLRNVRTRTTRPRVAALSSVGSIVIVWTMSAMIRTSRPSRIAWPTWTLACWYTPRRSPRVHASTATTSARSDPAARIATPATSNALTTVSIASAKVTCVHLRLPSAGRPADSRARAGVCHAAGRVTGPLDSGRDPDRLPVAYAGEPGAFAEDAVLAHFGDVARVAAAGASATCSRRSSAGEAAAGVVPIENLVNGTVRENYDLLLEHDLEIRGRGRRAGPALPGRPARPATSTTIERVYSHIQALGQAEAFLRTRPWTAADDLQHGRRRARLIAERGERGAPPPSCRRGRPPCSASRCWPTASDRAGQPDPVPGGRSPGHRPGRPPRRPELGAAGRPSSSPSATSRARCSRCSGLRRRTASTCSKLESRPSRERAWEYVFWVDLDADVADPRSRPPSPTSRPSRR